MGISHHAHIWIMLAITLLYHVIGPRIYKLPVQLQVGTPDNVTTFEMSRITIMYSLHSLYSYHVISCIIRYMIAAL